MKNTDTGFKKCFISLLPDSVFHFFEDLRGIKLEEVEVHRFGDAKQQVAVERRFVEDFVEMVSGTANFTCQPAHATLIGLQLRPDKPANMDVAVVFHRLPTCCFGSSPPWQ